MAIFAVNAFTGDLEPTATPDNAGSAVYTGDDIYNRLSDNTTAIKRTGAFTEPAAVPGSTGRSLDEIYEIAIPTKVPKSGAADISGYTEDPNEDASLQKGVAWPNPRFTDNGNGTITDNLTGLVWLKNANRYGQRTWAQAMNDCNTLADDGVDLTDGSVAGEWRLPGINELRSLSHFGFYDPGIPNTAGTGKWTEGDAFTGVGNNFYWSGTTVVYFTYRAWSIASYGGSSPYFNKTTSVDMYVWPVRDGN